MKKAFLLFFGVFALSQVALSQYGGTSVFRFLNVPVSPQSAALGGLPVSLTHANPSQIHNNPAFLNRTHSGMISATWSRYLTESDFGLLTGAWHLPNVGTLGGGIRYLNYGEFDRIDASGTQQGTFNAYDFALKLSLSRTYAEILQYGVGIDFIQSSYDSFSSGGIAFSGGILVTLHNAETSFGLSFVNLGTQLSTFDGIREALPFDLRAGATHKLEHLPLRLSITAHSLNRWEMRVPSDDNSPDFTTNLFRHIALGGEFLFSQNFHVRLGYNQFLHDELRTERTIDMAGFGFGVGINIKGIGVEFSRNSYSEMGHLFKLGIQTRL
ncbi:MAG: type IX secretion system protein PorQ [Balneolales bacterium]|nr:type IX secretion system protein PorQ [Balneolales bacterium]